jgi:sugar diacid utilization regulator
LEERMVTLRDIAFVRAAATRRARAGFALEDYLNAFRVGQQAFWEAVVECAGQTPLGQAAALTLAGPLMRYCDFASTHAAHAYVEYQQYMVADADRERRDLLEHLLAGEMPSRGPLVAAAQAHGITAEARMLVATAVTVDARADADAPHVGSAAIACAGLHDAKTLVVVRQTEIVAVLVLGADADACRLCDRVDLLQRRLRSEGVALAMGVSTVATGVGDLPRAYEEAHVALSGVGADGGVEALARLTPFGYLALRADDTARRLVNPRLRAFLDEDRRRGRVLTQTIRAVADADLNLRVAAERLQVHPNTAQYRLRRIEERTGCNPRHIADLLDLLVAIALDDALAPTS